MKLQRQHITMQSLHTHTDNNFVNASMSERLEMVWEITKEVCALSPKHDAERRLQRHIVRITHTQG